jgi:O-methyltransferase
MGLLTAKAGLATRLKRIARVALGAGRILPPPVEGEADSCVAALEPAPAPLADRQARSGSLDELEARVAHLEERLLGYYKNRWDAIDKLADYLVGTQISGDYMEFGVFEGKTFAYACNVMAPLFPEMRFIALDSFEGLPEPRGVDALDNYTSGFYRGQFAYSREAFSQNLAARRVDLGRVVIVEGWFDATLRPDNPAVRGLDKVAAAWIDCDIYESTVPVLEFLTSRLSVGAVLLFDDWRCFRNLADFGEQRACREWLDRNPQITLNPFVDFGFHGQAFTVGRC